MNPNNNNNMNNQENVQASSRTMMDYLCPNTMAKESPIHTPVQAYGFEIKLAMLSNTQAINDIRSHLSKLTTSMRATQNERGKFPSQPQPNPQGPRAAPTLSHGERPSVNDERNFKKDESVKNEQVGGKTHEGTEVRNNREGKNMDKENVETPTPAYHPPAPFPQRLRMPKKPNHNAKIYKLFEQVKINIPLSDTVKQIPAYAKFLKDPCMVKRTLNMKDKAFMMEQVSSIIQSKTTPKYKDLGCPTVSIVIGATTIEHVLLDLGANVNLLPYTVYKKLGLGELKPTSITL
ncbi:uncharacterized protein LOC130793945 [Actinidia eriantha]|uniref:uncharacterized protein LOC130793945 n=1 Tax=Actinidia eriantha TaxID=165200 RepID=UPI00258B0AA7|nr:uncharacterized protein LOC130793945 [Actinidia eriantha]